LDILIFLRPTCDCLLLNSLSSCTATVFGRYSHLHLKELEILRQMIYCLKYDKIGLPSFCFSGPELVSCTTPNRLAFVMDTLWGSHLRPPQETPLKRFAAEVEGPFMSLTVIRWPITAEDRV
jgi:hypothetical protein